jgi:hypothetical protein
MVSKAQVMALAFGDAWLARGANILLFGSSLIHDAHLSMWLKFKSFLQGIAGRRTSQTAGCRRALHVASVHSAARMIQGGRSLTELIRRELTIFDQTAHGRRTNG